MMVTADDAFLSYLRSVSGQTVHYLPGSDDLEGALQSFALYQLCERCGVDCAPYRDGSDLSDSIIVLGAGFACNPDAKSSSETRWDLLFRDNRVILAPCSISRFEDIESYLTYDATVFCRDEPSSAIALLTGVASQRVHTCHDLTVHLDVRDLALDNAHAAGVVTVGSYARRAGCEHDNIDLRLSRSCERRAAYAACHGIVIGAASMMQSYAEVRTDRPGVAIFAAGLGKSVTLLRGMEKINAAVFETSIKPLFASVSLDAALESEPAVIAGLPSAVAQDVSAPEDRSDQAGGSVEALQAQLERAKRDVEKLRQDGEIAFANHLSQRLRAEAQRTSRQVLADKGNGSGSIKLDRGSRLVPISEVERYFAEVEQGHKAQILKAAEDFEAQIGRLNGEAELRLTSAIRVADETLSASQDRSAREVKALTVRFSSLERAIAIKSTQVLDLQSRLDDQSMLYQVAETRGRHMRVLIDRHAAALADNERAANETRMLLRRLLKVWSRRALMPLRVAARTLIRIGRVARQVR